MGLLKCTIKNDFRLMHYAILLFDIASQMSYLCLVILFLSISYLLFMKKVLARYRPVDDRARY